VLTRALGFDADLAQPAAQRALWSHAQALLPQHGIEAYTQGLMDLGATCCTARQPRCEACPLQALCVALREGAPQRYPVKTRKLKRGRRQNALLWLTDGARLWLTRRPAEGVWAALWSLPEFDSLEHLRRLTTGWPGHGEALPAVDHALTHFDWHLQPWRHHLPGAAQLSAIESALPAGRWVTPQQAADMGLPAPVRKLLAA
jgi:A/G-specific adenine glycosylase